MPVIPPPKIVGATFDLADEVPVRCRVCRDHGRNPSTFFVLWRIAYPGADPYADIRHKWPDWWDIVVRGTKGLYPLDRHDVTWKNCNNRGCHHRPRIGKATLVNDYRKAVRKKLGTVWV